MLLLQWMSVIMLLNPFSSTHLTYSTISHHLRWSTLLINEGRSRNWIKACLKQFLDVGQLLALILVTMKPLKWRSCTISMSWNLWSHREQMVKLGPEPAIIQLAIIEYSDYRHAKCYIAIFINVLKDWNHTLVLARMLFWVAEPLCV